ncbi:hypothetical protein ACWX0K_25095 (plasmid) [Nitrobacteraceae bacterium UC4446_H13]
MQGAHVSPLTHFSPFLYEGEEVGRAGGFPVMTYKHFVSLSAPLVVFVPGTAHTGRISYGGHQGYRPDDFLAYWFKELGYNFLAVSYPIEVEKKLFSSVHPEFTVRDWGIQAAEAIIDHRRRYGLTGEVIIVAWSNGGRSVQTIGEACAGRGQPIELFVALDASPPIRRSASMEQQVSPNASGYAHNLHRYGPPWYKMVYEASIVAERPAMSEEVYLTEYTGEGPVNLQGYGLRYNKTGTFERNYWQEDLDTRGFDFGAMPMIGIVTSGAASDPRHSMTGSAVWGGFLVHRLLEAELGDKSLLADLPSTTWRELCHVVRSAPATMTRRVNGNHFFLVGKSGAQEGAYHVDALCHACKRLRKRIAKLLVV